ncbi:hypothetical protein MUK70_29785 [Dyadobacter chenwenxiniae]|uniref:Lipocalin-like domain-containing protein n=1 Tax=Dyadobacter chenwenxiniae TaxID=2906456 RepID=A0A9X1PPE2_9BACT|nr:hypothetical protein [Dyadobacter chenwenxiniae]MCF0065077.1 hypothetical protein [Dyadobacter chenwenxiniae]UON83191.1 hypothetical protein MUK70_29785 [Dyadobacter chenwenxiniae]
MKIHYSIFVTFLFVSMFSCKENDVQVENNGLVGKWKMIEFLYDPGDGSGKFQKASEGESSIVEFKANGDFKETKGLLYSSINSYTKYKILNDSKIELSGAPSSSAYPTHTWTYSNLTATTVILGFGCDESCAGKFIAIK